MEMGNDHVLVTGALGWLGYRLVHNLVKGLRDHPDLVRPNPALRIRCLILPGQDPAPLLRMSDRLEIITGDLRNPSDCTRFLLAASGAVLFHTAGVIHPRRVREFYEINLRGTCHLLDAAINARVRRAVVVSSNSPCGCNPHPDHVFDELSPYHPYMHYGRSKMKMELAVNERQRGGRIETVIIRPPWFYGPNQPARQTLFFKMIREGRAPIVGAGNNLRSMSYVDNLCQGLVLAALTERANGQTYWIADRRPYSMNEVVNTVERLMETEFDQKCVGRRLRLPGFVGEMAGAADFALQSLGIYHQKIHVLFEMNRTIACSVARAERELGYEPKVELEEGMRRSLRWCIGQGLLP